MAVYQAIIDQHNKKNPPESLENTEVQSDESQAAEPHEHDEGPAVQHDSPAVDSNQDDTATCNSVKLLNISLT